MEITREYYEALGTVDQLASARYEGNPRMLFNHYRDLMTPEDATAFWEIVPS